MPASALGVCVHFVGHQLRLLPSPPNGMEEKQGRLSGPEPPASGSQWATAGSRGVPSLCKDTCPDVTSRSGATPGGGAGDRGVAVAAVWQEGLVIVMAAGYRTLQVPKPPSQTGHSVCVLICGVREGPPCLTPLWFLHAVHHSPQEPLPITEAFDPSHFLSLERK